MKGYNPPPTLPKTVFESEFGPVTRDTRIVYTAGTFDIFHAGHVNLLSHARKIAGPAGLVIVGLNTDEFIREYKGEHPVNNWAARSAVLHSIRGVDAVIAGSGADSKPAILQAFMQTEANKPYHLDWWFTRFIVIGSDWATRDYYGQMGFSQRWLDEHRITLCYVPYTEGVASSKLRRHLCD